MSDNSVVSLKQRACQLAREGKGVAHIERILGLTDRALIVIREKDPEFDAAFRQARKLSTEYIEDSLLTAHEDITDVMRARLYSENARAVLKYRNPEVYGDRIQVDHRGQIDLNAALNQGLERVARLQRDSSTKVIEGEVIESTTYEAGARDIKSLSESTIDDLLS